MDLRDEIARYSAFVVFEDACHASLSARGQRLLGVGLNMTTGTITIAVASATDVADLDAAVRLSGKTLAVERVAPETKPVDEKPTEVKPVEPGRTR